MTTDSIRGPSFARRFWWVPGPLAAVLLVALPFSRPIEFHLGDTSVSVSVQTLPQNRPFADDGMFIHSGGAGPTGSFSHGDLFGVKLGSRLLRLDLVEDPVAAAQRRLPKTLAGLIKSLDANDSWLKFCAFQALADMGASAQPALPALVKALERGDEQAEATLFTVSKAAGAKSVPALTNALASRNSTVRECAAEILGEIGPEAKLAIPFLERRLHDSEPRVSIRSAVALWKIDAHTHGSVPVLVGLLKHDHWEIRGGAAAALGELGSESGEAVPALLQA